MGYKIEFRKRAKEEFEYFVKHDKVILNKILKLIEDIKLHPHTGLGKPEALKNNLSGHWSRRITKEHRLVYKIDGDTIVIVASCRFHY
jgi:toxin YoeB